MYRAIKGACKNEIAHIFRSCQKFDSNHHWIILACFMVFFAAFSGFLVAYMSHKAEASPFPLVGSGSVVRMKMSNDVAIGEIRKASTKEYVAGPAHRSKASPSRVYKLPCKEHDNSQYGLINFSHGKISIANIFNLSGPSFIKESAGKKEVFGTDLPFADSPSQGLSFLSSYQCALPETFIEESILSLSQRFNIFALSNSNPERAKRYHDTVKRYADRYQLSPSLVLAIIRAESNFNPYAVSPMQAIGLMQVVPSTAGGEVYSYLNGFTGIPSYEDLMQPDRNIRYGTTYLHLLGSRYFQGVRNKTSRELCIIAAYNGGPGAVLRVFNQNPDLAVSMINSFSSDEIYEKLTTEMPSRESRKYVKTVLGHARTFSYIN